jgi:group I intron endonuclease
MQTQEPNPSVTTNEIKQKFSPDKCNVIGIYGLRNKVNNKWYVGQSYDITSRWGAYRRLQCANQPKLLNALRKHGYDNFEKITLEECIADQSLLGVKEDYWIRYYDSVENGYNCRYGGANGKFSEEAKLHVREACKTRTMPKNWREHLKEAGIKRRGRKLGESTKNKMSISQKIRYQSSEKARENIKVMSAANVGHHHSEETKRKIGAASRGRVITKLQRIKLSKSLKQFYKNNPSTWIGKKHTIEARTKMASHDRSGVNCPSLGLICINNGVESRKIAKDQPLPEGFVRGRLLGTVWIHNGVERKFIKKGSPLPEGFVYGKLYHVKRKSS